MGKEFWEGKHFSFFTNRECEYFPCHEGADAERFNCLFCYCPLYTLGKECGGNPLFLKNGIKDCSRCMLPHEPDNYGYVTAQFNRVAKKVEEENKKPS